MVLNAIIMTIVIIVVTIDLHKHTYTYIYWIILMYHAFNLRWFATGDTVRLNDFALY